MLLAIGVVASVAVCPIQAQTAVPTGDAVRVAAPGDDAVDRGQPVFRLTYDGVAPDDERRLRFRIELRPDDEDVPSYVFDQRERGTGWDPGHLGQIQFRPPRPLTDGRYRWQASIWDGVAWDPIAPPRRLRVDSVPPNWIDTLKVRFEDDGRVELRWQPVTVDLEGGPEYVARYHVFRFELGPHQPMVRPYRIAVVETPGFVDVAPPSPLGIIYYRIAAEDQAGNVTGIRQ